MRDDEVVASTVTGDPSELAEAYDRYAGVLYSYCRWLLREPADAAGVVRDTFVIASAKLAGLREPDRLRSWLFAVARSECLRKPRSRKVASPSGDAAERPDETADVIGEAELAGIHALIRAAVDGLNADEREVITQVCHGVEVPEVAAMLGVSRDRAYALFSRARDQLEASVGVLLTGRSGYRDCPALGTLLTGWDGRLTVRLRERAGRHIGKCPVCSDRRRRELRPATLLSLSPGALFGLAAAPGTAAVPAGLRAQALRMATGTDPDAAAYRAALDSRHRSFGKDGFPRQPRSSHIGPLRTPHAQLAVAAGTATIAVTAVTVAVLLPTGGTHSFGSASLSPVTGRPGPPGPSEAPSATRPGASGRAGAAPTASSGSSGSRLPRSGAVLTAPSDSALATSTPPVASSSPPGGGSSSPSQPVPTRGLSASASSQPAQGTLTVAPTSVVPMPLLGGSTTLTAENGPVTWSISEPASLIGSLNVSPSSGTLAAGQSVTVTITVQGLVSLFTRLTVSPGGQQVTVVLGLG